MHNNNHIFYCSYQKLPDYGGKMSFNISKMYIVVKWNLFLLSFCFCFPLALHISADGDRQTAERDLCPAHSIPVTGGDETNTHSVPQLHIMRLTHATLHSDVLWLIIHSLVLTHTYIISPFLFLTHMQSHFFFSHTHFLSYFLTFSHSLSFGCLWEAYCYSCKPTSIKMLTVCQKLFLTEEKQLPLLF